MVRSKYDTATGQEDNHLVSCLDIFPVNEWIVCPVHVDYTLDQEVSSLEGEIGSLGWTFWLPRLMAVATLIAMNAFFVALEFSVVAARRPKLETRAQEGDTVARLALYMIEHTDLYIASAQLGITLASLALGWVGESTVAALIYPFMDLVAGQHAGLAASHAVGTTLSFALITFLHIVLGEQVPKIISIRSPENVLLLAARPMRVFTLTFRPFIWALDRSTALVLRILGVQGVTGHHHAYSLEEIKFLLQQSEEAGVIRESETTEILSRVFDFSERLVREVMIPRTEIIGIDENATVAELLQIFKEHRHARFPVYRKDLDHIIGIVAIKDILAILADDPSAYQKRLKDLNIIKPAFAIPETRRIGDLFQEMRDRHIQMAVVIDEYGGTAGLVTLEEMAEEILGRVTDEWVREEPDIREIGPQAYDVNAQLRVDEVNEKLGIDIPESDLYETVAGFILYQLGHIPEVGEELVWNGLLFRVLARKGPKIERVSIILLPSKSKQESPAKAQSESITPATAAAEEVNIG